MTTIYGIIDPDTRRIRYVGEVKATVGREIAAAFFMKTRLEEVPLSDCGRWLTELHEKHSPDFTPEVVLLEQTPAANAKHRWVKTLAEAGADLVNTHGMGRVRQELAAAR